MPTTVTASARLHFGLFNLSGINHFVDGGAGIGIDAPTCKITIGQHINNLKFSGSASTQMRAAVLQVINDFASKYSLSMPGLSVTQSIPEHVGLGSKTAALMALGQAISRHFSLELDYLQIASIVKRGGTSGVGVHLSEFGGLVADRGHLYPEEKFTFLPSSASEAAPPALLERNTPPQCCSILHFRLAPRGLSGKLEKAFFQENCPVPAHETVELLKIVDNLLLPSIRERSIGGLNEALDAMQYLGLKAREWQIQTSATRSVRDAWQRLRHRRQHMPLPPMCLSSLGPTLFMLSDSPREVIAGLAQIGIQRAAISVARPTHSHMWHSSSSPS